VRILHLTSPHMKGPEVRDAQWLLRGNNRWKQNFRPGPQDGDFGLQAADATNRAKWALGYPKRYVNRTFGPKLYSYLLPKTHKGWAGLPLSYRVRRKLRARKPETAKSRALALAATQVGVHESPYGSNRQKFGAWYGFNGVPWCAIFVSYCLTHSGFSIKSALAYQFEWWANSGSHGLSRTSNPEPGDIVVYHIGQGHTGLFSRWLDRRNGVFEAIEGNTSGGGSQNNGGIVMRKVRNTHWAHTVFVRVGR